MLEEAGYEPECVAPGIDDSELEAGGVSARQWVVALSHLKWSSACAVLGDEAGVVVLSADTVVVLDGRVIGQPRDEADARSMIEAMSGRRHSVVSGVTVGVAGMPRWLCDETVVDVGEIGGDEIDRYLTSGDWRGKAGGYNLSERVAAGWPIEWSGDAGTVMGLPMTKLVPVLDQLLEHGAGRGVGCVS